jgi:hypothetical protein
MQRNSGTFFSNPWWRWLLWILRSDNRSSGKIIPLQTCLKGGKGVIEYLQIQESPVELQQIESW